MSRHSPTEPLDLTHSNTERCLFSFKVLNKLRRLACCLPCFCRTGLIGRVKTFEVYITHHITNGPYGSWPCCFCSKDTIQNRRAIDCPLCLNSHIKVIRHLRQRSIRPDQVYFLFDNLHERFEFLGPRVLPQTKHVSN